MKYILNQPLTRDEIITKLSRFFPEYSVVAAKGPFSSNVLLVKRSGWIGLRIVIKKNNQVLFMHWIPGVINRLFLGGGIFQLILTPAFNRLKKEVVEALAKDFKTV